MNDPVHLSGPVRRLAEELTEDGIELVPDDPVARGQVLYELDHARRVPAFENRHPTYGAIILPAGRTFIGNVEEVDIIDLDHLDLASARSYADGRSAFLVHRPDATPVLACFDRPIQFESELVHLQESTGAQIVQRTAVLGSVRLFTDEAVLSWTGRHWAARPTATTLLPGLRASSPELRPDVARGLLDLAVHILSPSKVGATLVVTDKASIVLDEAVVGHALDIATAKRAPALSVTNSRHYQALFSSLRQHDLATLISATGRVEYLEVGLRSSREADVAVDAERGMRHRSAQRFSFDHPCKTLVVVSEDGPVTIYRNGQPITLTRPDEDLAIAE
ncbi:MAG: DNA integrity scanning protein DisA nucleotide-binding domain protein [Actinomycetota bacterium]|nr:DNA integrity scanning protein DisA nucleotide-binding domain protein [Actinomycetota bacterium]